MLPLRQRPFADIHTDDCILRIPTRQKLIQLDRFEILATITTFMTHGG